MRQYDTKPLFMPKFTWPHEIPEWPASRHWSNHGMKDEHCLTRLNEAIIVIHIKRGYDCWELYFGLPDEQMHKMHVIFQAEYPNLVAFAQRYMIEFMKMPTYVMEFLL